MGNLKIIPALRILLAWACVLGMVPLMRAQETAGGGEGPVATLRVFVDLVQVPVLVLNDRLEPVKDIDASKFSVSVDSGPAAHPRHVRVEGDDPIALGVLLDVRSRPGVMDRASGALAALPPAGLHYSDHVTLFALQCRLFRALDYSAARPTFLKDGVERVLKARAEGIGRPSCTGEVFLWDAMYRVIQEISGQAGRRVLMVVSDGADHGSKHTWNEVRLLAQSAGVAIFGLSADRSAALDTFGNYIPKQYSEAENRFRLLCESSGGIVLEADRDELAEGMSRVITLVRQRYVVEFSRPRENVPGQHDLLVKVAKGHPLVRPAGVSISIPDPAVEKDPMTIPRDTTDALELGKRKILVPTPQ